MKNRNGRVGAALALALSLALAGAAHAQEPSAEELAQANNPLANMKAFNVQNYYYSKLYGVDDDVSNTFWFRGAATTGPVLWRASLPISQTATESGFGDLSLFGAYVWNLEGGRSVGVGPQMVFPSGASGFGQEVFQAGVAAVYFDASSPLFQWGGLLTWQTDVNGDPDDPTDPKPNTSLAVLQPIAFWQLGGGTYLRMAPLWVYDLETDNYNLPFGIGIGKVVKAGGTVFNLFVEPQFTLAHQGAGQPAFQVYSAVNMQFPGG